MPIVFTGLRDAKRGGIVPASWYDTELLEKMPLARPARIVATFPRSLPLQRFYRALIAKVNEAAGLYPHPDRLHDWLRVRLGMVDEMQFHDGSVSFTLRSTAFDAMDQAEFLSFVHMAIDVLVEEILNRSVRRSVLIADIERMVGVSLAPDPRNVRAGSEQNALDHTV